MNWDSRKKEIRRDKNKKKKFKNYHYYREAKFTITSKEWDNL